MSNQKPFLPWSALAGICGVLLMVVAYYLPAILNHSIAEMASEQFYRSNLPSTNFAFLIPLTGLVAAATFAAGRFNIIPGGFPVWAVFLACGAALYFWALYDYVDNYSHTTFQAFFYVYPVGVVLALVGLWHFSRSNSQ